MVPPTFVRHSLLTLAATATWHSVMGLTLQSSKKMMTDSFDMHCPGGYEQSSQSLKGPTAIFDADPGSMYPAVCAALCEKRGCTSFAVGTTQKYCFSHPDSPNEDHHCSGCWTFTDGQKDVKADASEPGMITCIKEATQPCARPALFCTAAGDTYVDTVDCDEDGIADPQCSNPGSGHQGFVASASWCNNTWPTVGCAILPTPVPTPPPTPIPPAPPVLQNCPKGYVASSQSLKGPSGIFNSSVGSSYPAVCATMCDACNCTAFVAGTTTAFCFQHAEGNMGQFCTGCWTFTDGQKDVKEEAQEPSMITCLKEATQPCARPALFCTGAGDTYLDTVDCDEDGIADPQCFNLGSGHLGFVASASWCDNTWPTVGCAIPPTPAPA